MKKTGFTGLLALVSFGVLAQTNNQQEFKPYSEKVPGTQFDIKMVPIQGGTFTMGSGNEDKNKRQMKHHRKMLPLMLFGWALMK